MVEFSLAWQQHTVPLDTKGCICHFTKWQIHPFISKGTNIGRPNQPRCYQCREIGQPRDSYRDTSSAVNLGINLYIVFSTRRSRGMTKVVPEYAVDQSSISSHDKEKTEPVP